MSKLWEKGIALDREVELFTSGEDARLDLHLAEYDILGSIAHVQMLMSIDLLTESDGAALTAELRGLLPAARSGELRIESGVEDIHSQVELLLTRSLGEIGKRIHTARSRNDQVLVDLKMYLRAEIRAIAEQTADLARELLRLSFKHKDKLLPGYTHLQVAMPSSFGLWFGAYAESLAEDLFALQAAWRQANRNPLGSAAGYGSSIPVDRMLTTRLLGFEAANVNVVHAQMTRGKMERSMAWALSTLGATIARMSADVCFYSCDNLRFISLPPELSTGSSIMPHKHNPDVFELLRAQGNRLQALPNEMAMICAGLTSGYHRDVQLLKEHLIPAIGVLRRCLRMMRAIVGRLEPRAGIMDAELYDAAFTVENVNNLVAEGVPFRDAYRRVADDVAAGSFVPNRNLRHTHLGSIGNPGIELISAMLDDELQRFDFERVDTALAELAAGDLSATRHS